MIQIIEFWPVIEDLFVSQYNSILGGRINKKSFELKPTMCQYLLKNSIHPTIDSFR